MKKRILGIVTLALMLGVVTANNAKDVNYLEVKDILLEDTNKVGNKVRKNAANEVAENKISEVKAQVSSVDENTNGERFIDIRFVAGIDTYTYTNAKFNITIKNGDTNFKTIEKEVKYVYEKIEAQKDILTAKEAFGEEYNYMLAYTIKNIPETAWGYDFEVTAAISNDGVDYNASSVVTKNIEDIKSADEVTSPYMYIFGDVFEDGWNVATKLPMTAKDTYELTTDFNKGTFIICDVNDMKATNSKLKNEKGKNFEISVAGNYTLKITRNDMSADSSWTKTTEVNDVNLATAYYQLTPNFVIINELYLNGGNVGGWSSYVKLIKVNDTLFQSEVNLASSTDGFVVTAQESRTATTDVVFKSVDGKNLNIEKEGKYKVSISLIAQDETWTEIVDCKNNYRDSIYLKLVEVAETRTNVIYNGNTSATTSSTNGTKKTGDKVFDTVADKDANRWESVHGVDPQWIEIDLGSAYNINGIDIQWYGSASAKTYKIEVSIDGETWTTLKDVTNASTTRNRLDSHEFEETSVRYIKITGTSRTSTYGYSIAELYVWGA